MTCISYVLIVSLCASLGSTGSPTSPPQDQITEITLERTPCYGRCATYSAILRADGTVTYSGRANVPHIGSYRGTVDKYYFERLSELVRSQAYSELQALYSHPVSDQAGVITSVVVNGQRKTVKNYAGAGPIKLWGIEMAIDAVIAQAKWQ